MDAEDVARWMGTNPPAHEQTQALDDLIGVYGNDRGLLIFARGVAIATGQDDES